MSPKFGYRTPISKFLANFLRSRQLVGFRLWKGGSVVIDVEAAIVDGIFFNLDNMLLTCPTKCPPNLAIVRQLANFWRIF